ncbi:MAG TPA: RDD family protein [Thermoanaerobaculia bacterium]|nr:RDD family protein [Thermoanaerobaculia bacterium]
MTRDRYLERALRNVIGPRERVETFATDLRAHFEAGAERGEGDAQVAARLGPPEEVAASFMEGITLETAGFFARLFAFVADAGVLAVLGLPAFAAVALTVNGNPDPGPILIAAFVFLGLAMLGVVILYFPLLEGRYSRTPGKWWMRLRVVGEEHVRITFGQAFLRRLSLYFELLALDAIFVLFTRKKQRAFDIVARTMVIHEPGGRAGAWRWLGCFAPWAIVAAFAWALVYVGPRIG